MHSVTKLWCHRNDVAIICDYSVINWFFIGLFGLDELTFRQNWFRNDGLSVDYLLKWQWRKWNVNLSNRTEFRLTGWYSVFINWVFLWKLNTHQRLIFELEQVSLKIYRLEHFPDSMNYMFSYMYVLKIMKNYLFYEVITESVQRIDQMSKSRDMLWAGFDYDKLGCMVRMVVDSILPHAECGPNDHRKEAPPLSWWV